MYNEEKAGTIYKVVVLGANGGIGQQAVLCALKEGHLVTAILRTPSNLELRHPNLQIVQGDVMKPEQLNNYLIGQDVVISAIGKNSLKQTTLYSQGNQHLITAIKKAGVKRAFFISASGLEVNPTFSFIIRFATKYILQFLLRYMYADLRIMEGIIKDSGIDWTIIRPPKLLDKPETGKYRIAVDHYLDRGYKISRADVAHFMIHHLLDSTIVQKTVEVGY